MTLPLNLILEKNKISTPNPWIILLEITLTDETVIRIARNNENVVFGGQTYTAFNFDVEPTNTGKGEIHTVTIRVSNVSRLLQPYVKSLNGCIRSTVKLYVVNAGLLAEDYSELELTFSILGCQSIPPDLEFILGAPNPMYQRALLYRYLANNCVWTFKSAECAYTGQSVSCARNLLACRQLNNSNRFGGCYGLSGNNSIRVVF